MTNLIEQTDWEAILDALDKLALVVNANSASKGFWDSAQELLQSDARNHYINTKLLLIVSEVTEAMEGIRNDQDGGIGNLAEELADVIIRALDLGEGLELDIGYEIVEKIKRNAKRPAMHGGKKF